MPMIELLKEAGRPARVRREDSRWSVLAGLAALGLIIVLILCVYLLARYLFAANYLSLYLKYGYYVSLAFTFVAIIFDLDQERDLISTHPFRYATACLRLMRGPLLAAGADFKRDPDQQHQLHTSQHQNIGPIDASLWGGVAQVAQSAEHVLDLFVSGFFSIVFIIVVAVWLLLAAPVQYFVFLICGAPARVVERSRKRVQHPAPAPRAAEANILEIPASTAVAASGPVPVAAESASYEVVPDWRPVRMTSALALLVLWSLSRFFS